LLTGHAPEIYSISEFEKEIGNRSNTKELYLKYLESVKDEKEKEKKLEIWFKEEEKKVKKRNKKLNKPII